MAKERRNNRNDEEKIPMMLSLREMILIVAAVASIVAAWYSYGTRLSLVEQELVRLEEDQKSLKEDYKEVMKKNDELKDLILKIEKALERHKYKDHQ